MIPSDGSHKPLIHTRTHTPLPDNGSAPSLNGNHTSSALVPLPVTPGAGATPTLGGLMVALKRRWFLALVLAALASSAVVAAILYVFPAKYVTLARLELASRGSQPLFRVGGDGEPDAAVFRGNQQAIIKSPLVLSRALNSDKLKGTAISNASPDSLERAIKVDFSQGPAIMTIKLTGEDPEEVTKTLEAIIEAYIDEAKVRDNRQRTAQIADLERTLVENQKKLDARRNELRAAEIANKVPDATLHTSMMQAHYMKQSNTQFKLNMAQDELRDKQIKLDETKARLKTIDTEPVPPNALNLMYTNNLQIQEFQKEYAKLATEVSQWKGQRESKDQKDAIQRLREQQKAIDENIKETQDALRPMMEVRYRGELEQTLRQEDRSLIENIRQLEQRVITLTVQLEKDQAQIDELNLANKKPGVLIDRLRDDVEQIKKTQERLAADVSLLRAEPAISSKIIMLKVPEIPTSKDYAQLSKIGTAGGLGSFLFVLFGVAFLEFRSRKINAAEEVTQELGLTLVGTMPKLPNSVQRVIHNGTSAHTLQWQSIITESIDAIRTQLLHAARSDGVQVVMVTSAVGGEGKTSLASQLAASLARAWRKTLLVDGDLRNPAAHRLFNVQLEPGFSEVLRRETSAVDAVKPTTLSRLWILPAGHWDTHAVQALAQDGVRATFDQLKEQYDFIIVDSCPVLPVADSLLLGQHVDAVIFSVLRDVSRLPSVKAAQQKLQGLGVRMLGAVVIGEQRDSGSEVYRYTHSSGT